MKKAIMVSLALAALAVTALGQYPKVSISQVQQVPFDSLVAADAIPNFTANATQPRWTLQVSPYVGDTVTITGICVVPPMFITYTASGWTMLLYDTANIAQWRGILVRANVADSTQLIADGFFNVEQGDVITMTGVVSEFPLNRGNSLTQFQPIAGNPISVIGSAPVPQPTVKNVGDFYRGIFSSGKVQYVTGEPFEGMYVEFHNLTINNLVNTGRGTFSAVDASGNEISDYDWSRFYSLLPAFLDSSWVRTYATLGVGVRIDTIRGVISTVSGSEGPRGFRVAPIFKGDIVFGIAPPLLSSHRRNPVVVAPDSSPVVSVKARPLTVGAVIQSVGLHYSVNYGPFTLLPMTYQASDTTYRATIPTSPSGSTVRYFLTATDDRANTGILANSSTAGAAIDTSKGFFFYTVLNRPLTISDVQYTPFINGRTPYLGAVTQLGGIITGDTTQISLSPLTNGGTNAWYMQSGTAPWGGIWLTTSDTSAQKKMARLRAGDSVTVRGTVQEQFDVTRLGSIDTNVVLISSGNPVPAPLAMTTGTFNVGNGDPGAEPYEGMLVRFTNVQVSDIAPTFSDPTEFSVNDGSGAIVVRRDGRHRYSNVPADTASGKSILHLGDRISTLTGIIYYSFNQYKVVPRGDADFGTITVGVGLEEEGILPEAYALYPNYPNPFNPSTTIVYHLPVAGYVSLKVYDLLGREVALLVDQPQEAGRHLVSFAGQGLASGVYFCRLQAGSFVAMRKMALVK